MNYEMLDKIESPADLKDLSRNELRTLASEIRDLLVKTLADTGGHLAPNLGVVELTIGLHRALKTPDDKIVWDVGHQSYVHKILTGRRSKFATLRTSGGLSGFPKRAESQHDSFDSGHASSALSIALGMAEARDQSGGSETVLAVVGDGALTGGVALEALNHAGHRQNRLIIVLNDNERSIACNVGALSSYLSRIRLDPTYNRFRDFVDESVKRIPGIGEFVFNVERHLKDSLKQWVVPGMLFEELGFKYVGPIDGHNIELVENSIRLSKHYDGPVLIHALTTKGKGYGPAEKHPEKFHGTAPFDIETGEPKKKNSKPSYTEVFGRALVELARDDGRIVAITAAMASGTGLEDFSCEYPERFYDVGIAEQHAVAFAAGLALQGRLPVVAVYSTFLERAYDQIIQDICLQKLPVVFALDRGGLVGEDGPTHHGAFDLSYLRHIPEMTVMAPSHEGEFRKMLYTALKLGSPVAIRYPRGQGVGVGSDAPFEEIPLGKGEVLAGGKEVALIAVGRMVSAALGAADLLREKGISPTVIDARFIKPLDSELILAVAGTHRLLVTLEENALLGGFGSAVVELLADRGAAVPTLRLGLPDRFVAHGTPDELLTGVGLDPLGVALAIEGRLKTLPARDGRKVAGLGQGDSYEEFLEDN